MARMEGFEPPTAWFVARYSIQLSYMRISLSGGIMPPDCDMSTAFCKFFYNILNLALTVCFLYRICLINKQDEGQCFSPMTPCSLVYLDTS